jgi:glycerophosphoryl diester phosphodiesterase
VRRSSLSLAELRGHLPRVPTLQEALDRFGARIPWNLEIKSPKSGDYAGLEQIALDEVRRRGILEHTLFSSFSDSVLTRLASARARARLGTLVWVRSPVTSSGALRVGAEAVTCISCSPRKNRCARRTRPATA